MRMRWSIAEWNSVFARYAQRAGSVEATEAVEADAFVAAQRVLPKARHRARPQLVHARHKGVLANERRRWLERLKAGTAKLEVVEQKAPAASPAKPSYMKAALAIPEKVKQMRAAYGEGTSVRWTPDEWALVTRDYDARRLTDDQPEVYSLYDAQDAVLPVERRRAIGGLQKSWREGRIAESMEEARRNARTLRAEESAALGEQSLTPTAPAVVEPTPIQATPAASTTAPTSEAFAAQVAKVMTSAIHQVLDLHTLHVKTVLDARLDTLLAAVRAEVHHSLELELGPVSAPPAASSVFTTPDSTTPRLRIDVVGLEGTTRGQVQQRYANGHGAGLDLRFYDGNGSGWDKPAPHAVLVTKFISHRAQNIAKNSGAEMHFANGALGSVIEQIERLRAEHAKSLQ